MASKSMGACLADNSPKTAISRKKVSTPLKYILGLRPGLGRVLHHGPGRPDNPDRDKIQNAALEAVEYDPGHGPDDKSVLRKRDFDQVISLYVLNVLPPKARADAVLDIYESLKRKGVAYIAVRSKRDVAKNNNDWRRFRDGFLINEGSNAHFQRGFTAVELKEALVDKFKSVQVFDEGGFVIALGIK